MNFKWPRNLPSSLLPLVAFIFQTLNQPMLGRFQLLLFAFPYVPSHSILPLQIQFYLLQFLFTFSINLSSKRKTRCLRSDETRYKYMNSMNDLSHTLPATTLVRLPYGCWSADLPLLPLSHSSIEPHMLRGPAIHVVIHSSAAAQIAWIDRVGSAERKHVVRILSMNECMYVHCSYVNTHIVHSRHLWN